MILSVLLAGNPAGRQIHDEMNTFQLLQTFPLRSPERNTVTLANRATADTIFGGVSALVLAKRADKLGVQFAEASSAHEIVADVYSRSTGKRSVRFGAWECPECGSVHVGQDNALKCCAYNEEENQ
jgi:rubrerythrin